MAIDEHGGRSRSYYGPVRATGVAAEGEEAGLAVIELVGGADVMLVGEVEMQICGRVLVRERRVVKRDSRVLLAASCSKAIVEAVWVP